MLELPQHANEHGDIGDDEDEVSEGEHILEETNDERAEDGADCENVDGALTDHDPGPAIPFELLLLLPSVTHAAEGFDFVQFLLEVLHRFRVHERIHRFGSTGIVGFVGDFTMLLHVDRSPCSEHHEQQSHCEHHQRQQPVEESEDHTDGDETHAQRDEAEDECIDEGLHTGHAAREFLSEAAGLTLRVKPERQVQYFAYEVICSVAHDHGVQARQGVEHAAECEHGQRLERCEGCHEPSRFADGGALTDLAFEVLLNDVDDFAEDAWLSKQQDFTSEHEAHTNDCPLLVGAQVRPQMPHVPQNADDDFLVLIHVHVVSLLLRECG